MERIVTSNFSQIRLNSIHPAMFRLSRSPIELRVPLKQGGAVRGMKVVAAGSPAIMKSSWTPIQKAIREAAENKTIPAVILLVASWFSTKILEKLFDELPHQLTSIQEGDMITIMGADHNLTGAVQTIGCIGTTLVTVDGQEILFPTKLLRESKILMPLRRFHTIRMDFLIPLDSLLDYSRARGLTTALDHVAMVKKGFTGVFLIKYDPTKFKLLTTVSCLVDVRNVKDCLLLKKKIIFLVFIFFYFRSQNSQKAKAWKPSLFWVRSLITAFCLLRGFSQTQAFFNLP